MGDWGASVDAAAAPQAGNGGGVDLWWAMHRWKRPPVDDGRLRPSIYVAGFGYYPTGPAAPLSPSRAKAKARWKILGNFLRPKKQINADDQAQIQAVSVRRHHGFALIPRDACPAPATASDSSDVGGVNADTLEFEWTKYSLEGGSSVMTRTRKEGKVTLQDMIESRESKVDNTGNVCLWPSEEVMAAHILENKQARLAGKNVCELGAGVGLAGLAFVAAGGCNSVLITDGNAQCVESLKVALEANIGPGGVGGGVDAKLLVWSESLTGLDVPRAGTYDTVCGADCLFFEDYHGALIHTIDTLLSDSGKALLYAPLRGGSLDRFCEKAKAKFDIEREERYSEAVWEAHLKAIETSSKTSEGGLTYDPAIHYPILLTLTRKKKKVTAPPAWAMSHGGGCKCCKGKRMPMW